MTAKVLGLALSYAFIAFVLLLLLIRARLSMTARLTVVLAAAAFYLLHFFSLNSLRGWPTEDALPDAFTLHAFEFKEPNPAKGESGRIHLWIQSGDWQAPRAYSLPYSDQLHDRLEAAQKRRNDGYPQEGRANASGTITFSDLSRRLPAKNTGITQPKT